jgi:ABC-type transporter Mla subunit MlaD
MTKERFHFALGLFTLAGLALAAIGFVYLGGGHWHHQTLTVETYFDQSVSGLALGAPVRHRGVDVGTVTKIDFVTSKYHVPITSAGGRSQFAMANLILVEAAIDRDAVRSLDEPYGKPQTAVAEMVKEGLRIRLVSSLLGGGGYLDADFVDEAFRSVPPAVPWVPEDIYIPSQPSSTTQLIDNLERIASEIQNAHPGELVRHADALLVDAHRLTTGLDTHQLQQRATALLDNLTDASGSLEKILKDDRIQTILGNVSATASNAKTLTDPHNSELAHLITKLQTTTDSVNRLLSDPSLKTAIANTGPLTSDARRLVNGLAELVAGEREELAALIRSLSSAAKNIDDITSDAKDNPSRLLFGEPPPKINIHLSPEKK